MSSASRSVFGLVRVLPGHRAADVGQDAGRQAQLGGQRVEVARPRAAPRPDQQLMLALGRDELLDERVDRVAAAVDQALAADLHDVGIWENGVVRRGVGGGQQLGVRQGAAHEHRLQRAAVRGFCHDVSLPRQ
jgi:hypothetical protein